MLARPAAIAATLLFAAAARGQEPLYVSPLIEMGGSPRCLSAGDLDDDGLFDLVLTRDNNALAIQLNLGGEQFGPPSVIAVTNISRRTALADYDGDGDLDIALAVDAPTLELVNLYRGVGDGTFQAPLFSVTSDGPNDLEAADLDADGDPDLAVACSAGNRISLLLGDGDATFAPKVDVNTGGSTRGLSVGLLDDDEHLDIGVAGNTVGLRTLLGDGSGGFSLVPGTVGIGPAWADVDLGDVDADGVPDALLAGDLLHVGVALGAGDGTFAEPAMISAFGTTLRPVLADVDEDGDADAAFLSSFPDGSVNVALSGGDGSFGTLGRFGSMGNLQDFAVEDFNGDGDLDLLTITLGSFTPSRGLLLPGDGAGGFGPQYKIGDGARELDAGDIDGDGRLDVISADLLGTSLTVALGRDFGGFASPAILIDTPTLDVVDVLLADVIEDGLLDAVALQNPTSFLTPRATVFPGDGSSVLFGVGVSLILPSTSQHHVLQDLDADGHLDLAITLGSTVRTWRGDGLGGFASADVQATATSAYGLAAGDLDADGIADLVAGNVSALANVYIGHGDATFEPPLTFALLAPQQTGIAVGDLDGDLDLDVAFSTDSSAVCSLLFNDGTGFMSAPVGLSGVTNPYGIEIADVTNDGVPDVLATGGNPAAILGLGEIAVWEGLGGGAFGAAQLHHMSHTPNGLVVRDFDGDGWLDAAAASFNDDLSVRLNRRGPWDNLGHPLAGELGLPRQRARGTLLPGEFFEFRLTDARPGGLTGHVVGLSAINAPFKGGVMVPAPTLINFPLSIGPTGDLSLQGPWPGPAGATGVELYFQFWGADPAGVKGFSASNGLRATLP